MKKQDLIKETAIKSGLTQDVMGKALNGLIEVITETLKKGEEVKISKLGTFKITERKARKGHNPRTREIIELPAVKSPMFSSGKTFKQSVR